MGCKWPQKWWYVQGLDGQLQAHYAVSGLKSGGIYKEMYQTMYPQDAVSGLKSGGIYKATTSTGGSKWNYKRLSKYLHFKLN